MTPHDLSWSQAAAWVFGLATLVCAAIVLWPRKKRGLARPVSDSRNSVEIFKNLMRLR